MKKPEIQAVMWGEGSNKFKTFIQRFDLAPQIQQLKQLAQFA
jgi:hypothetical protein